MMNGGSIVGADFSLTKNINNTNSTNTGSSSNGSLGTMLEKSTATNIDLCLDGVSSLQNSECSSYSSDSDLSFAFDGELQRVSSDCEEMPSFEIRLLSPVERTPSPIDKLMLEGDDGDAEDNFNDNDTDNMETPTRATMEAQFNNLCHNNPDFVALHELNAQISPPSDSGAGGSNENEQTLSRSSSLETIFEGVFLNTPPRQKLNASNGSGNRRATPRSQQRLRANLLLEQTAINRLQAGKENLSPLSVEPHFLADATSYKPKQLMDLVKQQNDNFSDLT